jgi:hypothetical protein
MDAKTKDFLKKVDYLIDRGIVKNTQAVIDTLEWNKSVMSSVRNGKLPVPQYIYNKFKEAYADDLKVEETFKNGDDKDKIITLLERQIALLEQQLRQKDERITYLIDKLNSDFVWLRQSAGITAAYAKAVFQSCAPHRAKTEGIPLKKVVDEMDTLYAEAMAEVS